MNKCFLSLAMLLLAGCGHRGKDGAATRGEVLSRTDVDVLAGWAPGAGLLTHERAHSGRYSLWVDASHDHGLKFENQLEALSSKRFRGVVLTYWVYIPNRDARAELRVRVLSESGQELASQGIDLPLQVHRHGSWQQVSSEILFPSTATHSSWLSIQLVHTAGGSPTYLDDLEIAALR